MATAGAEGPELQVRLGQPPAAFRPRAGQHRGGAQVLDPPGPGELVHTRVIAGQRYPMTCYRRSGISDQKFSRTTGTPAAHARLRRSLSWGAGTIRPELNAK